MQLAGDHVIAGGLVGHYLNWDGEAPLLRTVVSLFNANREIDTEFRERLNVLITECGQVLPRTESACAADR